jgi:hypothetical protein
MVEDGLCPVLLEVGVNRSRIRCGEELALDVYDDGQIAAVPVGRAWTNRLQLKMNSMAKSKTVHVVPKNGSWAVRSEGRGSSVHSTQAEAITAARHLMKDGRSGQFVVWGQSGRIVKSETYRLPKVKTPPRKSRLGRKKIEEAVGSVVLDRLNSSSLLSRA